jgi:hypothetical protein
MKNLVLGLVSVASLVFGLSFTVQKGKEDKLSGEFQVFVNSFKMIESTPVASESSFEDRKNDSLIECFQIYTFDFDSNFVQHHFLLTDVNGETDSYDTKSKITNIETDGNFAYLTVEDESLCYSKDKEKIFVLNLNNDSNYPMLSIFWKNGTRLSGTYSIDNNTLDGLTGNLDPDKVFNDQK